MVRKLDVESVSKWDVQLHPRRLQEYLHGVRLQAVAHMSTWVSLTSHSCISFLTTIGDQKVLSEVIRTQKKSIGLVFFNYIGST